MSSPPPPNPLPTTTTTPNFLQPQKHSHPPVYQTFYNPQHSNSRPHHQQPPLPVSSYPYTVNRPHGFLNSDQLVKANPLSAPLQQPLVGGAPTVSANTKVVGQSSVAFDNSLREKNGDDAFIVIRDRKVQPQYPDGVKSLPKPLPASTVEARKEDDLELEEENPENVDHLSAKELLQLHVNHAKKVRARLRNQRLQRIERYKDRLALLLPGVQVSEGTSLYAQCRSWLKNGKLENVDHLSAKELLQLHVNHAKKVRARLRNQRLQRIERYKDRLALLLPAVADQQPKNDPAS
uniref:Uncharacterized protein n=1 Tax=Helianthus annuus TaxID=4232 RepID=A0A251TBI5_HELAN